MTVRHLRDADLPYLAELAEKTGFPYCDPRDPLIECVLVAVDENDVPVMALGAKRLVELYLWPSELHSAAALSITRKLADAMKDELCSTVTGLRRRSFLLRLRVVSVDGWLRASRL